MQFVFTNREPVAKGAATRADLTKNFSGARMKRFDNTLDNGVVIQKMLTEAFSGPAGAGAFRKSHHLNL
jgi:hypothetical protein